MSRTGTADATDDSAWFEQLFRDTRVDVLAYLTRRVAAGDAADLLAEVYLVAWRRRPDLPEAKERLWLFGAARRLLAQHRRQQAGIEHLHRELSDRDELEGNASSSSLASPAGAVVRSALDTLTEVDGS